MHAYASEDPLFRALNARGQRETDGELGDFCVRCHAPLAVELGLTEDGLDLDELEPEVLGIGCVYCHTVDRVDGTHNNPLRLATDAVLRGGIEDPVSNGFHRSAYSPLHDRNAPESADLCGSCHDIVAPSGAHIERTYVEWSESVYGQDSVAFQRLTCGSCHMDGEDAPVAFGGRAYPERRRHAHTWPGVDIALTDFPHREAQRALVQASLDTVVNPQLCVEIDTLSLDTTLTVDLENLAAGHSFPSGASADRRVWVELVAVQDGEEVFVAGRVPDGTAVEEVVDPDRWSFYDRHFDGEGQPTHHFWEVETVQTNLLPAPNTFDTTDPRWVDNHRLRTWVVEGLEPDSVTVRVFIRPFPLDLADDLVANEGVAPEVREALPTFELANATLTWTPELGRSCVQ